MSKTRKIGNYVLKEQIGSGAMGSIYIGEDTVLQRTIAIKAIKQELSEQADLIQRFKSEAITLARINHPNVATVFAFVKQQKQYYLIIEYISGCELSTLMEVCGALPVPVALFIFKQILNGVKVVHKNAIVHRDLKPANIMLTDDAVVKVMDFGLAQFQNASRLTRHGKLIGTLEYMSPEQIKGEPINQLSDIYSLGIVLFELITGRLPFAGKSDYDLMRAHIEIPVPSPLQFKSEIPDQLESTINKALAKDPAQRFQSISEFLNAIDACLYDINNAEHELYDFINLHGFDKLSSIKGESHDSISLHDKQADNKQQKDKLSISLVHHVFSQYIRPVFIYRPWLGYIILCGSILIVVALIYQRHMIAPVVLSALSERKIITESEQSQKIINTESENRHLPIGDAGILIPEIANLNNSPVSEDANNPIIVQDVKVKENNTFTNESTLPTKKIKKQQQAKKPKPKPKPKPNNKKITEQKTAADKDEDVWVIRR